MHMCPKIVRVPATTGCVAICLFVCACVFVYFVRGLDLVLIGGTVLLKVIMFSTNICVCVMLFDHYY